MASPSSSGSIWPGVREVRPYRAVAIAAAAALAIGGAWTLTRTPIQARDAVEVRSSAIPRATQQPSGTGSSMVGPVTVLVADDFIRPFEYAIPPGSGLRQSAASRTMHAWSDGTETDGTDRGEGPTPIGQSPIRRGLKGVVVGALDGAWSHGRKGRYMVRTTVNGFLADLDDESGLSMGGPGSVILDRSPASMVELEPPFANDVHVSGPIAGLSHEYVRLRAPARLIAASIDEVTIFVLVWADDQATFDSWLPTAMHFVESIHFRGTG